MERLDDGQIAADHHSEQGDMNMSNKNQTVKGVGVLVAALRTDRSFRNPGNFMLLSISECWLSQFFSRR